MKKQQVRGTVNGPAKRLTESGAFRWGLLVLLLMGAHFIPLERPGFAADDYANYGRFITEGWSVCVYDGLRAPERPLSHVFWVGLHWVVKLRQTASLPIIILSTVAVVLSVYWITRYYIGSEWAFFATAIYILLPNLNDIYSSLVTSVATLFFAPYLFSYILFLKYSQKANGSLIVLSLILYLIGLLTYEVGAFLPLVMLLHSLLFKKPNRRIVLWYILPAVIGLLWRFTGALGFAVDSAWVHTPELDFVTRNILKLVNELVGWSQIRNIIYGITAFVRMPVSYGLTYVIFDALFLCIVLKAILAGLTRGRRCVSELWLSVGIMTIIFGPFLFHGISSRHTVFISIGVVLAAIHFIKSLSERNIRITLALLIFLGLIVSQGNAWNQVMASRIQNDMFQYFKNNHIHMSNKNRIVIDTFSFSKNVPNNVSVVWEIDKFLEKYRLSESLPLGQYYGARLFQSWGLRAIPTKIFGLSNVQVILTTSEIKKQGDQLWMRRWGSERIDKKDYFSIPVDGTVIVDFDKVYPNGWPADRRNYAV